MRTQNQGAEQAVRYGSQDEIESVYSPASFIGEAIAQFSHVVADSSPFCAAYNTNILDREDSEEEVLIGPVIPVLVHLAVCNYDASPYGRLSL